MLSVKMPNGKIIQCDAGHYENVIKRQHRGAVVVDKNTTKEVVAETPILKAVEDAKADLLACMTKDQLEAYAFEKYAVDLDKRKSTANLIKAIEELGG